MEINLPKTAGMPETNFEWKIPQWSNAIERDRARVYFIAYSAAMAFHFLDKAMELVRAGRDKDLPGVRGAGRGDRVRLPRGGARGTLAPHGHQGRQDRQLPPLPADAVERLPTDSYGTPGPYEDAVAGTPIFEENGPEDFKGIDIMRAVRSFDPCLPCGVHMYLGDGKVLEQKHSPTLGIGVE